MMSYGVLSTRLIICAALVCALAAPSLNATPPAVTTLVTLHGEAAGDRFGTSISTPGDFNGDGPGSLGFAIGGASM